MERAEEKINEITTNITGRTMYDPESAFLMSQVS